jgi:hypothetical protein
VSGVYIKVSDEIAGMALRSEAGPTSGKSRSVSERAAPDPLKDIRRGP